MIAGYWEVAHLISHFQWAKVICFINCVLKWPTLFSMPRRFIVLENVHKSKCAFSRCVKFCFSPKRYDGKCALILAKPEKH